MMMMDIAMEEKATKTGAAAAVVDDNIDAFTKTIDNEEAKSKITAETAESVNKKDNVDKIVEITTTTISSEVATNSNATTYNNNNNMNVDVDSNAVSSTTAIEEVCPITSKALKRCLSVPNIGRGAAAGSSMTLRSAAAAAALKRSIQNKNNNNDNNAEIPFQVMLETPKKYNYQIDNPITPPTTTTTSAHNIHIAIPRSNPSSREVSPAPMFNIFAPRTRRYSASFSPLGGVGVSNAIAASSGSNNSTSGNGTNSGNAPLYLTPRVSQLRKEECADLNTREVNHEREVHSAMQMSQSWEDLTLVTENWSCKSDEFSNPLQVALPAGITSCSSPSPTR